MPLGGDVGLKESGPRVSDDLADCLAGQSESSAHLQKHPPESAGCHFSGERVKNSHVEPDAIRFASSNETESIRGLGMRCSSHGSRPYVLDLVEAHHLPHAQRIDQREEER